MTESKQQRVLAVKVEINWKEEASKALFNRLRDLSWQAAQYRNETVRRRWAEAVGLRVDPAENDKHDVTKQGRRLHKQELSGAAYSAAEQEVQGAWQRDAKFILAGRPLPEWKPTCALSIRGHKNKSESGVRLELEDGQYVAYLSAQNKDCPGGCWLRLPIAKNTKRDEHQGGVLSGMVSWSVPIAKATVQIKQHEVILRLTFAVTIPLPLMGERVAVLGPARQDGRLLLRTELQTRDYTSKLAQITDKKDRWDLIRRRVMAQIGRRKGHARLKRQQLARKSTEDWLQTYLHTWSRDVVEWCSSQGIGTIRVDSLGTGDWPAYKFVQQVKYKAADLGMVVTEGADVAEAAGERTAKAAITKKQKSIKARREAVRELTHQLAKKSA